MSALPKPSFPVKAEPRHKRLKKRRKIVAGYHPRANNQQIQTQAPVKIDSRQLPRAKSLPKNLQALMLLQKTSFGIALASLAASMGLYISSVRIPQQWSLEYETLEKLQRQERQLTTINESIRYHMAQQAVKEDSQLSILAPEQAIFVAPTKLKVASTPQENTADEEIIKLKYSSTGY